MFSDIKNIYVFKSCFLGILEFINILNFIKYWYFETELMHTNAYF